MRLVRLVVVAGLTIGCSADQAGNDRISGNGSVPAAAGNSGNAFGTTSGASGAAAPGSFGNSNATVMTPVRPMTANAGQGAGGDGCAANQFCASTNADGGCGSLTLTTTVKMTQNPGNVLLIWDRSLSMNQDWNGMPRYLAAGNAIINALMPIQNLLTIGAVLFPSPNGASGAPGSCIDPTGITCAILGGDPTQFCNVNPITSADQLPFEPGPQAIMDLQTKSMGGPLYAPVGATPTAEAVSFGDMALASANLVGTTVAVIITDGEPNCNWDQNATVSTIGNWLSQQKIQTYVVGLADANMGNGPAVLSALAQAGGTMQYLTPADPMTLQKKLADVVSQTISSGFDSCSIDLMPATATPDKLQLVVTEPATPTMEQSVPHDLGGTAGGWTISADGAHVTLSGGLCDSAKSGRLATLKFKFGCKDIPPIPPSHVT